MSRVERLGVGARMNQGEIIGVGDLPSEARVALDLMDCPRRDELTIVRHSSRLAFDTGDVVTYLLEEPRCVDTPYHWPTTDRRVHSSAYCDCMKWDRYVGQWTRVFPELSSK